MKGQTLLQQMKFQQEDNRINKNNKLIIRREKSMSDKEKDYRYSDVGSVTLNQINKQMIYSVICDHMHSQIYLNLNLQLDLDFYEQMKCTFRKKKLSGNVLKKRQEKVISILIQKNKNIKKNIDEYISKRGQNKNQNQYQKQLQPSQQKIKGINKNYTDNTKTSTNDNLIRKTQQIQRMNSKRHKLPYIPIKNQIKIQRMEVLLRTGKNLNNFSFDYQFIKKEQPNQNSFTQSTNKNKQFKRYNIQNLNKKEESLKKIGNYNMQRSQRIKSEIVLLQRYLHKNQPLISYNLKSIFPEIRNRHSYIP